MRFKDLERWDIRHNQTAQRTNAQIQFESLENLTIYMQRGKTPVYSNIKKYPVIAQKCVQWSGLDIQKALFINPDSLAGYAKERFLQDDDILLNSTGIGTLGRVGLYKSKDNPYNIAVADGHITIIRFDRQRILPKYFYHYFASSLIQDNIEEYATGSTKQKELSLTLIKQIKIPLPPIEIQQKIIDFVESKRETIRAYQNTIQSLQDSISNELKELIIT
ncbi:MAG: restriction endonuclease subunit S [Helicobacter sp.]|nr:restriction endonuclease subunit S [Helicobacter sp.]